MILTDSRPPNLEEQSRCRAYELYEQRGKAYGYDLADRRLAVAEVNGTEPEAGSLNKPGNTRTPSLGAKACGACLSPFSCSLKLWSASFQCSCARATRSYSLEWEFANRCRGKEMGIGCINEQQTAGQRATIRVGPTSAC